MHVVKNIMLQTKNAVVTKNISDKDIIEHIDYLEEKIKARDKDIKELKTPIKEILPHLEELEWLRIDGPLWYQDAVVWIGRYGQKSPYKLGVEISGEAHLAPVEINAARRAATHHGVVDHAPNEVILGAIQLRHVGKG